MKKLAVRASIGAVGLLLSACGQPAGLAPARPGAAAGGGDEVRVQSALTADPGLAHPEYDIDDEVEWFVFGKGTADEINAKLADNFRLLSVSAHSPTSFAASLVKNVGNYQRPGNGWAPHLSESEVLDLFQDTSRRVVDIAAYYADGAPAYAAVWVASSSPAIAH